MRPEAEDKYQDMDGNPISLYKLVRECPDWAINRIRAGEKAIAELSTLLSKVKGECEKGITYGKCPKCIGCTIKSRIPQSDTEPVKADTDCPDPCTEMTVKGCEDCADTEKGEPINPSEDYMKKADQLKFGR